MNLRFYEEPGPSGSVVISTTGYFRDLDESNLQGLHRLFDFLGGNPSLEYRQKGINTAGWWQELGVKKKRRGLVIISFVFGQILFVVVSPTRTLARNFLVKLFKDVGLISIEEHRLMEKTAGLSFPFSEAVTDRELEQAWVNTRQLVAENIHS